MSTTDDQPSPRVAVVVATRDRGDDIVQLLESLLASDFTAFEVVVVDQSSADSTEDAVRPFLADPRLTYVRSDEQGLSRARNLGIGRCAAADVVVITDDDVVVPPEWLGEMVAPFTADPRLGVLFCTVRPMPTDEPGHTPHVIYEGDTTVSSIPAAWRAYRAAIPLGAGMAIRRTTWEQVGGFDEDLGAGARFGSTEDSDFSWRAARGGWHTTYTGRVEVLHNGFRDLGDFRRLMARDLVGIGGALSKYLRDPSLTIRVRALLLACWFVFHFGIDLPMREVLARRRPKGFRRPLLIARGVVQGLRTPLDRADLLFARSRFVSR